MKISAGFLIIPLAAALGMGLWIASLNVKYRDFQMVVPFIVRLSLYVSPVGFSSSIIPDKWRLLYSLNPIVGAIDGFRWSLFGADAFVYWPGFFLSIGVALIIFISGLIFFRKTEKMFADFI